jgi:hypothetical protein
MFVISRHTNFLIGSISNIEVLELNNSVKGRMNSVLNHGNHELHHAFQAKPCTETYVGLCKCCKGISDLQLCLSALSALQFKFLEKLAVEQG